MAKCIWSVYATSLFGHYETGIRGKERERERDSVEDELKISI